MAVTTVDADYLVVGAGATGMAFTDALIDNADVRVALVDRRSGPGGHWLDDYEFVRLHQASAFYGVASTVLGGRRIQSAGPEAGLYERATRKEVENYYDRLLTGRMLPSGTVSFYPNCEYLGDRRFASRVSTEQYAVPASCRIVDARYLAPDIPATTAPPFGVAEGAHVVSVNDLVTLGESPRQIVIAGSGKTATDAVIWLLDTGISPDSICWVRPRDPWMLNRAVVQPDPAVYLGMAADTMAAAAAASSPDDLFLGLEEAGVMVRIDRTVTPTMAKTPTVAQWELDRLQQVENVVRLGHIRRVEQGRVVFADADVVVGKDALVVHCAAPGLKYPPLVPIWGKDAIRVQPVRAGFPCFGAALVGFVEATRDDDGVKNRLCPPSPLSDTPSDWMVMNVLGTRAAMAFGAEPDVQAWADRVALNPAAVPPEQADRAEVVSALERFRTHLGPGLSRLTELAGLSQTL